jgi:hypothetical protein
MRKVIFSHDQQFMSISTQYSVLIGLGPSRYSTAFVVFNEVYFENNLSKAVITIQSSPKSFGYFTVHKVWKDGKDSYSEINIGAVYLSRPIGNVLATLMHEMVHLYCLVNGIRDTRNGGRYHKQVLKAESEKRDLKNHLQRQTMIIHFVYL